MKELNDITFSSLGRVAVHTGIKIVLKIIIFVPKG